MKNIEIKINGTEKQVAWATDILNAPIVAAEKQIEYAKRIGVESELATIPCIEKGIETYVAQIEANKAACSNASFVIDRKGAFGSMAAECIRVACVEAGISPANLLMSYRNKL